MSIYETIAICILAALPIALLGIAFIKALSARPGYRRRGDSGSPTGEERRCPNRKLCEKNATCTLKPGDCATARKIIANLQKHDK